MHSMAQIQSSPVPEINRTVDDLNQTVRSRHLHPWIRQVLATSTTSSPCHPNLWGSSVVSPGHEPPPCLRVLYTSVRHSSHTNISMKAAQGQYQVSVINPNPYPNRANPDHASLSVGRGSCLGRRVVYAVLFCSVLCSTVLYCTLVRNLSGLHLQQDSQC